MLKRRGGQGDRGFSRRTKQISWGLVDQSFSSATNFGLAVLAGRIVGPGGLGVVYLGFSAYLIALSTQRALITDPFVVGSSSLPLPGRTEATRRALSVVLLGAVTATAVMLILGLVLPSPDNHALLLFVPWLAGALLQDFWRVVLFRDGRGASAALNDGLWAIVMAATVPLILLTHDDRLVVATWGAGAVAGGLIGVLQTGLRPARLRTSLTWWRDSAWPLGRWLTSEAALLVLQTQLVVVVLVSLLGATDVGGYRAVEAVFAPMTLLTQAIAFPGLPILTRLVNVSYRRARVVAARLSALTVALLLAYLLALGLLRHHVLQAVFGAGFSGFDNLVFPVGARQLLLACSLGFSLLVRAQGRGRMLLLSRAIAAFTTIVFTVTFAATSGLLLAVSGMVLGAAAGAIAIVVIALHHDGTYPRPAVADARRARRLQSHERAGGDPLESLE